MWNLDFLMTQWRQSGTLSRRQKACLRQQLERLQRHPNPDETAAFDWACEKSA
jgi:hypothetical protein